MGRRFQVVSLMVAMACTRVIDLGSTGVCAPPVECTESAATTCAVTPPAVGLSVDPAPHESGVLFGVQRIPIAAHGATGDFVIWETQLGILVGIRVGADGRVSRPLTLSCGGEPLTNVSVAWNGVAYLVVGKLASTGDLHARRYDGDGAAVDGDCVRLSQNVEEETRAAVTAVQHTFVVVWATNTNRVLGARVGASGEVQPLAAPLSQRSTGEIPGVAANGTKVLVMWTEAVPMPNMSPVRQLFGAVLSAEGTIEVAPKFLANANTGGNPPAVASNGVDFAVAWTDFRDSHLVGSGLVIAARVRATRITATGTVLDPDGVKLSAQPVGDVSTVHSSVAMVFDGEAYQATWYATVWGVFAVNTMAGSRLKADGSITNQDVELAKNAYTGTIALVPGAAYYNQDSEVWRQPIPSGTELPPRVRVSRGENSQSQPRLSPSASRVLALWTEVGSADVEHGLSAVRLLARRLDPTLSPIDAAPMLLAASPTLGRFDVAFDGTNHLVVWSDSPRNPNGILVPDDPRRPPGPAFLLPVPASGPAVCFDGEQWQVWPGWDSTLGGLSVVRLRRDGSSSTGPFAATTSASFLGWAPGEGCPALALVDNVPTRLTLQADGTVGRQPMGGALSARAVVASATAGSRLLVAEADRMSATLSWRVLDSAGDLVGSGGPIPFPGSLAVQNVIGTPAGFYVFSADGAGLVNGTWSLYRFTLDGRRLGPPVLLDGKWSFLTATALSPGSLGLARTHIDTDDLKQRLDLTLMSVRPVGSPCLQDSECASGVCGHEAAP